MKQCVLLALALSALLALPLAAQESAAPSAPAATSADADQCKPADLVEETLDPRGAAQELTSTECTISITCPDGTFLQCSSDTQDCFGGHRTCFVRCDGVYQWCPGYFGQVIC